MQHTMATGCLLPTPVCIPREETLTSACLLGPRPQLSLPPPQRVPKPAVTGWESLEQVMHPCSSEGGHTTLNTKLLAIHLAGEDFPDFPAGWGGGGGPLKQGCAQMSC